MWYLLDDCAKSWVVSWLGQVFGVREMWTKEDDREFRLA